MRHFVRRGVWRAEDVNREVKYVRLRSGEIRFVDPITTCAHSNVVAYGEEIVSAGRVVVDKHAETVAMGHRDSFSLSIKSAPGDEDAEAVRRWLFVLTPEERAALTNLPRDADELELEALEAVRGQPPKPKRVERRRKPRARKAS